MERFCVMTFGTDGGGSVSIRIPNTKASLADATVKIAMSQILGVKALKTKTGLINSLQKAVGQSLVVTDIELV